MKVLILYHAGAMESAHGIFHGLAKVNSIDLTIVVPERILIDPIYDPSGWLTPRTEDRATMPYRYLAIPLRDPAQYQLGFDRHSLRRVMRETNHYVITL